MRSSLALVLFLAAALASASLAASGGPVGSWDAKGNYTSPPRIVRFQKLHNLKGFPRPRYPIVLVHGLFGFDELRSGVVYGKYFVGVAEYLRSQGMDVLVPETTPFASLEQRATELNKQILAKGWPRFHIIAHSAGGLDARYAISKLGLADRVVSLTTVSTPHRGTWFADFALAWLLERHQLWSLWDRFGLERQGIYDISVKGMKRFNEEVPDAPGVRYFSFAGSQSAYQIIPVLSTAKQVITMLERASAGKGSNFRQRLLAGGLFPKEVRKALQSDPQGVVRALVGEVPSWVDPDTAGLNDGLVSVSSARWGEFQVTLAYDHLDEMGWFTSFSVKRFYRNITRMLADAGL